MSVVDRCHEGGVLGIGNPAADVMFIGIAPEIWLPIIGYENTYEVSSYGHVRNTKTGKVLKSYYDNDGYKRLQLSYKGGKLKYYVHVLVAKAFIGQPPKIWYEVNHKDGIKDNNNKDNLEWMTSKQNQEHAYKLGIKQPSGFAVMSHLGSSNGRALLNEKQVIEIKRLHREEGLDYKAIALLFNKQPKTISAILTGQNWSHIQ